jgi:hypothetical protein
MKKSGLALVAAMLVGGAASSQAQDVKVNALFIAWYTQMMDNNLRLNSTPAAGAGLPQTLSYYALGGTKGTGSTNPYNENGFSVRRSEIYVAAKINDEISGNVMVDPNQPSPILFDAYLTWKPNASFEIRVGQFKPIGYETTMVSAPDLLFTDRAQVARYSSDYRDRGVMGTYIFGDKDFGGRIGVGYSNGSTDRQNDSNAQKDVTARVDLNLGADQKFGVYLQHGSTNKADKTGSTTQGAAFGVASATNLPPSNSDIFDNKDETSTYGAYYVFHRGPWHAETEVATGLLGRRNVSFLVGAGAAGRQHLDQKFLGYQVTGAYTMGHHIFRLRCDVMDYNQGDKWYTTYNPYTQSAPGTARADGGDYTPKYTEFTAGYTYGFNPASIRKANIKVDYIFRSKNFLAPRTGQTGEQGGDSLVAAFQVWF